MTKANSIVLNVGMFITCLQSDYEIKSLAA